LFCQTGYQNNFSYIGRAIHRAKASKKMASLVRWSCAKWGLSSALGLSFDGDEQIFSFRFGCYVQTKPPSATKVCTQASLLQYSLQ
jgi:hypothetical protein